MGNQTSTADDSIFNYTVETPQNEPLPLSNFKGKKAYIVVNVACMCGLTNSNYAALQQLYEKFQPDLEIIGQWQLRSVREDSRDDDVTLTFRRRFLRPPPLLLCNSVPLQCIRRARTSAEPRDCAVHAKQGCHVSRRGETRV